MRELEFADNINSAIVSARSYLQRQNSYRHVCVHRVTESHQIVVDGLKDDVATAGLSFVEAHQPVPAGTPVLHIVPTHNDVELSNILMSFADRRDVTIIALVTNRHSSRVPVFALSIPKAGTHMLLGLLELFGIGVSISHELEPGHWCFLNKANAHSTFEPVFAQFRWPEDRSSHIFFKSAGVFIYRHPLDILISESAYFQNIHVSQFSYIFAGLSEEACLDRLINGAIGPISGRILAYCGWLDCPNVACISYEEMVGPKGGGDAGIQEDSIWSLQLKLHVSGRPETFAEELYDEDSPTFHVGKIGRHREKLTAVQMDYVARMNQNSRFMEMFGYDLSNNLFSRLSDELRRRPIRLG